MANFIVLSEQQMNWMRRVMKQMIEFTGYYCFAKDSLTDEDWDNIDNTFAKYTQKSRKNHMIIQCGGLLGDHLERTKFKSGKYQELDAYQLKQIEISVEEEFDIAGKWQHNVKDKEDLKKATQELVDCMTKYSTHDLADDLCTIFCNYLEFCMKENIGKQMLEQKQDKAAQKAPSEEGSIEKKHVKTR